MSGAEEMFEMLFETVRGDIEGESRQDCDATAGLPDTEAAAEYQEQLKQLALLEAKTVLFFPEV